MKRILKSYLRSLDDWDCFLVLLRIRYRYIRRYFSTPAPVSFSLRATVLIFILIAILPFHPMAIPTAIGAGISVSLMFTIPKGVQI